MSKVAELPEKGMTVNERKVAGFLKNKNIWWELEKAVYVKDEKQRPRVWTPDFYLPELGMHVEVCGTDKYDYEYRDKIYKKNKISVIFVHIYKKDKWKEFLIKEIKKKHRERWELIKKL